MNLSDVKQIGIVGGGASALMLCTEAAKLGISTCLLDPKIHAIGTQVATEHIIAPITSENVKKLSLRCDVVIFNTKPDFEMDVKLHAPTYPRKETLNELCHLKNIMELLEILEIPTPKTYYQDHKEEAYAQIEHLEMPFKFVKQYANYSKVMDVYTKEDLADFILEIDEEADSFMIQPISDYKQTISCICLVDPSGKVHLYDPIEITYGQDTNCQDNSCQDTTSQDNTCYLKIADTLTKTMVTRLARYNRKIMKELQPVGVYTIRYGIKANKSVEFIDITPELGVGSLLTLEAYETSVFEQYIRMVLGFKITAPQLENYVQGTIKETRDMDPNQLGHLYRIDGHAMCITRQVTSE